MLSVLENFHSFWNFIPLYISILIVILLILGRELYHMVFKHHSSRVDWYFPETKDWGEFFGKVLGVLLVACIVGLIGYAIVFIVFKMVSKLRTYLLERMGYNDMLYHNHSIDTEKSGH